MCVCACTIQVYGFVKLDEVFYAGSHGMDIMAPSSGADLHGMHRRNVQDEKVICPVSDDFIYF